MRVKLILSNEQGKAQFVPFNYQYKLSSWIYKILANADHEYSRWLHNNGYNQSGKPFKLFTFSALKFPNGGYKTSGEGFWISARDISLQVSFYTDKAIETFIQGLFANRDFILTGKQETAHFQVKTVQVVPAPEFSATMQYKCLSPILISKPQLSGNSEYLAPDNPEYQHYFISNLTNKLSIEQPDFQAEMHQISLRILGKFKKKGTTIKQNRTEQTKVIPYTYSFELHAPVEIQKIMYYAGAGVLNSQGLGCVDVLKKHE